MKPKLMLEEIDIRSPRVGMYLHGQQIAINKLQDTINKISTFLYGNTSSFKKTTHYRNFYNISLKDSTHNAIILVYTN